MADHLRLFLGIKIPQDLSRELEAFCKQYSEESNIKWIPPHQFHITVYFFGGVRVEMIDNLKALLELSLKNRPTFELQLDKLAWGPTNKNRRMIWAKFIKRDEFRELVSHIHTHYLQIHPEQQIRKSPLPHITLARLKNDELERDIELNYYINQKKIKISELTLWESKLTDNGPEYQEISHYTLK
ncbi:MAG: RNA 2',3'-cyclic phosphodiesterase [Bacteroidota bacterium]